MSEAEILENNKAIAVFYGAKYKPDDYGDFGFLFDKPFVENWHTMFRPDSMKFHTSWDWLMPCVEKIEAMGYRFEIFHESTGIVLSEDLELGDVICCHADTKLSATYQAVCEFIKQRNHE